MRFRIPVLILASVLAPIMILRAQVAERPEDPIEYLSEFDENLYLEVKEADDAVPERSYLVPLGALQKVRGSWVPEHSERFRGTVWRRTWQVLEGYESELLVEEFAERIASDERAELLFACDARSCGSSAQWANRIFGERLLYGRAETQRYRVFRLLAGEGSSEEYRFLIYGSARSSDRQYIHGELLKLQN